MNYLHPTDRLLQQILFISERQLHVQRLIYHLLLADQFHPITSFTVQGDSMPFTPGSALTLTATPIPADFTPDPGNLAVWTSSDTTNAPIVADTTTGFTATVSVPSSAPLGDSVTFTITYTNPDGTVATQTFTDTTVAPVVDITGFTIAAK